MKRIAGLLVLSGLCCLLLGQAPTFFAPETLKDGNVKIDVGYYGAPYVYDWNGDGKKDLLTGQFTSGYVRFYPNVGQHNNPSFNGFSYLQANGVPISVYAS